MHPAPSARFETLLDLLRYRAADQPAHRTYVFLEDGEREGPVLTNAQLDTQARAIGALLQERRLGGQRVLLLFPPGLDFIPAFFGCLYGGAVPVPAYPPDPARLEQSLARLLALAEDGAPAAVLTTAQIAELTPPFLERSPVLQPLDWIASDRVDQGLATRWRDPDRRGGDLALLQYTSGSTAAPKGVAVSHANILHNQANLATVFGQSADSVIIGWLPLHHDMGLIGTVLQPLYSGCRAVLMSPLAFLERPLRWLAAISRYRGTSSTGPNFAYDLCVRKIPPAQRAELDLSSWTAAANGAEPVRHDTLARFAEAFAAAGFRPEAFRPCFGLAEATLLVAGGRFAMTSTRAADAAALGEGWLTPPRPAGTTRRLVSCGPPAPGMRVVIVDPATAARCAPGQVGEIWVAGPSVALGYWGRAAASAATFGARLADGEGPFLRTGDLGILDDGELLVTGRLKDLILVRGQNHYPQDIERTVEASHLAVRPGCAVAFAVDEDDVERLVVMVETRAGVAGDEEVSEAVRRAVLQEHGLAIHDVVLVEPRTLPKTSSGKLQRSASLQLYRARRASAPPAPDHRLEDVMGRANRQRDALTRRRPSSSGVS